MIISELEIAVGSVITALNGKNYTISTAEQCTCGLIGASIASRGKDAYKGTITASTRNSINKLLAVPEYVVEKNGLISSQVAQQMALDTLYKFGTNIGIGVVGEIEDNIINAQICIAKIHKGITSFTYYKLVSEKGTKSENMEIVIIKTLVMTLTHINSI